jgi:sulfite exporter TauE/SafE
MKRINNFLSVSGWPEPLSRGILNGLLPCGAVYISALVCVSFSEWTDVVLYMILFGAGTSPVFVSAWLMAGKISKRLIKKLNPVYRALPVIVGIMMILRGAGLGIPYLSPSAIVKSDMNVEIENCCKP